MGRRLAFPGTWSESGPHAAMASSNFFSARKLSPIWKRTPGTRGSSGFWTTNSLQAARASGYRVRREMIGGDQELGVEDRALGVGTLRSIGEVGQVAFPGGDRLRRTSAVPGGSGRTGTSPS